MPSSFQFQCQAKMVRYIFINIVVELFYTAIFMAYAT